MVGGPMGNVTTSRCAGSGRLPSRESQGDPGRGTGICPVCGRQQELGYAGLIVEHEPPSAERPGSSGVAG